MPWRSAAVCAEEHRCDPEPERGLDPRRREAETLVLSEAAPKAEREERTCANEHRTERRESEEGVDLARPILPDRPQLQNPDHRAPGEEAERAEQVEEQENVGQRHDTN